MIAKKKKNKSFIRKHADSCAMDRIQLSFYLTLMKMFKK